MQMHTPFDGLPDTVIYLIIKHCIPEVNEFCNAMSVPSNVPLYWNGMLYTIRNWAKQKEILKELTKLRLVNGKTKYLVDTCVLWRDVALAFGYVRGELPRCEDWQTTFCDNTRNEFALEFKNLCSSMGTMGAVSKWKNVRINQITQGEEGWPRLLKNIAERIKSRWKIEEAKAYDAAHEFILKHIDDGTYCGTITEIDCEDEVLCAWRKVLVLWLPSYFMIMHPTMYFYTMSDTEGPTSPDVANSLLLKKRCQEFPYERMHTSTNIPCVADPIFNRGINSMSLNLTYYVLERFYLCGTIMSNLAHTASLSRLTITNSTALKELHVDGHFMTRIAVESCPNFVKLTAHDSRIEYFGVSRCARFSTIDLTSVCRGEVGATSACRVVTKSYKPSGAILLLAVQSCDAFKTMPDPRSNIATINITNCQMDFQTLRISQYGHLRTLVLNRMNLPKSFSWVDSNPNRKEHGFVLAMQSCTGVEESDVLSDCGLVGRMTQDTIVAWNKTGKIGRLQCGKKYLHEHARKRFKMLGFEKKELYLEHESQEMNVDPMFNPVFYMEPDYLTSNSSECRVVNIIAAEDRDAQNPFHAAQSDQSEESYDENDSDTDDDDEYFPPGYEFNDTN